MLPGYTFSIAYAKDAVIGHPGRLSTCGPAAFAYRHPPAHAWWAECRGLLVARRQTPDLHDNSSAVRVRSDLHHERRRIEPAPGVHREGPHDVSLLPGRQQAHHLRLHP